MNLEEYTQYRETKVHEQPGFAYNTYLCTIPLDFRYVGVHWHDEMELIYIKKGGGCVTVGASSYTVGSGCIVVVPPGCLHSISSDGRMEYENIIFSMSLLRTGGHDWCDDSFFGPLKTGQLLLPHLLRPGTRLQRTASAFLDAADEACDRKEEGYPLKVKGWLFLFLGELYGSRTDAPAEEDDKNADRIKNILTWVRDHFSESVSVAEAAEEAGYSAAHFMRFFRENTGQTFVAYLQDYRLSSAMRLLTMTDEPVGLIASACGFGNFSYFCRSFKKKYGMTPHGSRKKTSEGGRKNHGMAAGI